MIRSLTLSALAVAALATPALAGDKSADQAAAPAGDAKQAQAAVLKETSAAMEARQHLVRQGYINVSELNLNEAGRWVGTAQKDGKTVVVAIDVRRTPPTVETN